MIYLDSSVVLARIFKEDRSPADAFWLEAFVSSQLLQYEVLNRIHVLAADPDRADTGRLLLDRITLLAMTPEILARALEPFPVAVRTLDGLHLATMDFLRNKKQAVSLATYDRRLADAAAALGFAVIAL